MDQSVFLENAKFHHRVHKMMKSDPGTGFFLREYSCQCVSLPLIYCTVMAVLRHRGIISFTFMDCLSIFKLLLWDDGGGCGII